MHSSSASRTGDCADPTGEARKPRAGTLRAVAGGQCAGGSQKAWGSNVAPRQLCEAGRATDPSASQLPR